MLYPAPGLTAPILTSVYRSSGPVAQVPLWMQQATLVLNIASSPLFQDAAATVPATLDGDRVHVMGDARGQGPVVTAVSDAARPILRRQGGQAWLEFDGSAHLLGLGAVADGAFLSEFTLGFAGRHTGQRDSLTRPIGFYSSSTSVQSFLPAADSSLRFDGGYQSSTANVPVTSNDMVRISQRQDDLVADWIDGQVNVAPGTRYTALNATRPDFYLGGAHSATRTAFRLHAAILVLRVLSAEERAEMEAWLLSAQST